MAVVAALQAGVPAVPINPKSGTSELGHIVADAAPELLLTAATARSPRGWPDSGGWSSTSIRQLRATVAPPPRTTIPR